MYVELCLYWITCVCVIESQFVFVVLVGLTDTNSNSPLYNCTVHYVSGGGGIKKSGKK